MASLIIGASFLVSQKIKDKKDAKRDAKAKGYQKRYQELEDEHKKMQPKANGQSEERGGATTSLAQSTDGTRSEEKRRPSAESSRSEEDGPGRWVDEANLEKTKA